MTKESQCLEHECKECHRRTIFSDKHYGDGTFKCPVCLGWWGE